MNYTINLDWLQVFCEQPIVKIPQIGTYLTGTCNNDAGYKYQYSIAECAEKDYKYKHSVTIKRDKQPILHAHFVPRSSAIRRNAVSIKMHNSILYTSEWYFLLCDITASMNVRICNITRADMCLDCNRYADGTHPKDFIHEYVSGDSLIRKGSNKFCMIGTKGGSDIREEYLRFGSRASACSAYLYNKTKELRTSKYKPYIVKSWEDNHLDPTDVWRTELSITSKGLKVRNDKGRVRQLTIEDLAGQINLTSTFWMFAKQYWMFHNNGGQKHRKDMKFREILPFSELDKVKEKPSFLHEWQDSGRSERCACKTLERCNLQIADLETHERKTLHDASIIMARIGNLKRIKHDYTALTRYNDYLIEHFKGNQIPQTQLLKNQAFNYSGGVVELIRKLYIDNQWRM